MPTDLSKPFTRRDWLAFAAIWAIACAMLLARAFFANADGPLFSDTDDAMRMVMVRDFLAGQNWYDTVQHRLNTPYGAEIHWSRLIDLPLAVLLGLAQLVTGPTTALIIAGTIWPLALLGVLLWLSARIAYELVGPEALLPALVLPILSPAVLSEFLPGRVDHHNAILLLALATLLATLVSLRRPGLGWVAGVLAATAMAIAIEALPVAIAAILAFGLLYVFEPSRAAGLRRFGLGFAGGMVVHLMLARPPTRWLEAACDMISPVYALAGLAVGTAYLAVSLLPPVQKPVLRFALLAGLGLLSGAVVALVYPQCLAGPYGELDPWLRENWIAAIVEAKPWHVSLGEIPAYAIVVGIPVLLGAVIAGVALWRRPAQRPGWLILLVFIVCTACVMLAQIRGGRLAVLPTIPAAAWLIVSARQAYLARSGVAEAFKLLGAWLAFSGIVLTVLVNLTLNAFPAIRPAATATTDDGRAACLAAESFADLAPLPPERLMTPIDLGSHVLLETPHAVVAAPYHRNQQGVLDTYRFLNGPAEDAREIARERGLGLLVTCEALPEMHGPGRTDPTTVLGMIASDALPDWLVDVSLVGPLSVYAILP